MMIMVTEKDITDKLREVIDPELGINIVDMGLIYEVRVEKEKAFVKMTFTTPACPLLNMMLGQVKEKLEELGDFDIEVEVVFDPPWKPEMMSEKARMKLGII